MLLSYRVVWRVCAFIWRCWRRSPHRLHGWLIRMAEWLDIRLMKMMSTRSLAPAESTRIAYVCVSSKAHAHRARTHTPMPRSAYSYRVSMWASACATHLSRFFSIPLNRKNPRHNGPHPERRSDARASDTEIKSAAKTRIQMGESWMWILTYDDNNNGNSQQQQHPHSQAQ